jgi:hypothetical protein
MRFSDHHQLVMFLKKEFSEEDLITKKIELEASLKKAERLRNQFLSERVSKLKMRAKACERKHFNTSLVNPMQSSQKMCSNNDFEFCAKFILKISEPCRLEKFQAIMQKKEMIDGSLKIVEFLESDGPTEACDSIRHRPKILLSLIMLAIYPEEVMPEADIRETEILDMAKALYGDLRVFFGNQMYSISKHAELSCAWISSIQVFNEWLIKDKSSLLLKMENDFLLWTKTIGSIDDETSRFEWQLHSLKYQNEILKKISDVFGKSQIKSLIEKVDSANISFKNSRMIIDCDSQTCKWIEKLNEKNGGHEESIVETFNRLPITNVTILHELMLKENLNDFDAVLKLSGKSLEQISLSNRQGLEKLIFVLGLKENSERISSTLAEIFGFLCTSLKELAGDNEDYCQEISLADCSINPNCWFSESVQLLIWVLSMCKKCCSPARDDLCRDLEKRIDFLDEPKDPMNFSESLTEIFSKLFDLINYMRRDFCNFRLKSLVARIEGKGTAEKYELEELKSKFASKFTITDNWLMSEFKSELKPLEVLANAYINLLDPTHENEKFPETFYLDHKRLLQYQTELRNSFIIDASLIYIKNHLLTLKPSSSDENHLNIDELRKSAKNAVEIDEIKSFFYSLLQEYDNEKVLILKNHLDRLFEYPFTDKVVVLLRNREFSKIKARLLSENHQQDESLMSKINNLFKYNKACFGSIYDKILLNLS